jgi:hypothetical protein
MAVCFVSRSAPDWLVRVFAGGAVFFDRGFFTTFRFAHYFRFILCLS